METDMIIVFPTHSDLLFLLALCVSHLCVCHDCDAVVGSFDEMVAAQQELDRTSKAAVNPGELLKEVWECVRYRRREMKRRSNGRVLELWACLGCPVSSKLSFKLHADVSSGASVHAATSAVDIRQRVKEDNVWLMHVWYMSSLPSANRSPGPGNLCQEPRQ